MHDGHSCTFWVYIMASRTGTFYIGVTGDLNSRIRRHTAGEIEGLAKTHGCDRLVYYEAYRDIRNATRRQNQLQGWRREKKIALIEKTNPHWQDVAQNFGREMPFPGQSVQRTS